MYTPFNYQYTAHNTLLIIIYVKTKYHYNLICDLQNVYMFIM